MRETCYPQRCRFVAAPFETKRIGLARGLLGGGLFAPRCCGQRMETWALFAVDRCQACGNSRSAHWCDEHVCPQCNSRRTVSEMGY